MTILEGSGNYHSSDQFQFGTGYAAPSRIVEFEPGQSHREQLILEKLGINGWGRWQYFRKFYSGSWGENGQKPLSPKSQEAFFEAIRMISFPEGVRPSLFLTDEGFFELAWKDNSGKSIQFEFGSSESEIYIESTETELSFSNERLEEIIREYL